MRCSVGTVPRRLVGWHFPKQSAVLTVLQTVKQAAGELWIRKYASLLDMCFQLYVSVLWKGLTLCITQKDWDYTLAWKVSALAWQQHLGRFPKVWRQDNSKSAGQWPAFEHEWGWMNHGRESISKEQIAWNIISVLSLTSRQSYCYTENSNLSDWWCVLSRLQCKLMKQNWKHVVACSPAITADHLKCWKSSLMKSRTHDDIFVCARSIAIFREHS